MKYPLEEPQSATVQEILTLLETDEKDGLPQSEAESRAQQFGPNAYQTIRQQSLLLLFLQQFKSPIVLLLVVAAAVTLFLQDYIETISIIIVIILNAGIGFFMEVQARRSMQALKSMEVHLSRVRRAGQTLEIPSETIVPGDLILLEAGDVITGDGRLVVSNQLQCDESSLTGESLATEKSLDPLPEGTALGDRKNMVFKGTSVLNGNGQAVITAIGGHTELGTITSLVDESPSRKTPLERKIAVLTRKLIWITLVMISIFALTGFLQGKHWFLILETSIALAVAAFPEGLPIVATVALAYGMLLMAKRNVIVKDLNAVETLGSTNIILTDKTGTLTENSISVVALSFPGKDVHLDDKSQAGGWKSLEGGEYADSFRMLRLIGALCNNVTRPDSDQASKPKGDPVEVALLLWADSTGITAQSLRSEYERVDELPFSSETKIMGTLHKHGDGFFGAAKGSVEDLLMRCSSIQLPEGVSGITDGQRQELLTHADELSALGLRVLGFAYAPDAPSAIPDDLENLVFTGMVGFLDPPRHDIKEAILSCRNAGIQVVMITGDHPLTALNIAQKVGLVDGGEQAVVSGSEIPSQEGMSEDWQKRILSTSVFARTTPTQKLDIVSIYQDAGNIVAMTGDGVNDAPALKKADIGIAMGTRGTQVAKETANIVLKDDSFTSIAHAVAHGREIFQNIQKFVVYLVSCNLSEILIVTSFGFLAPASILLPLQILFLNMVTDVFPALALGLGTGDKTVMDRPPKDPKSLIISNKKWLEIGIYAALITCSVLVTVFYCRQFLTVDPIVVNNAAFVTLAFAQLFHVFNLSSPHSNILVNEITRNKYVWMAILLCAALIVVVFEVPQLRLVLGLEQLAWRVWALALTASLLPLVLVQAFKLIQMVGKPGKADRHQQGTAEKA